MSTQKLAGLKPEKLWFYFEALCNIPRPSKHEAQVMAYVKDLCKSKGWSYEADEVDNIVIRKPATPGKENLPGVILQGHVDMVPQKNSNVVHDFEKDPIKVYVDGEWVKAEGTTLGADNGIGAASALAILDSDIAHGPLEVLLTVDEETGMTGAFNLKPGFLKGSILINLDTEDEGVLCIGCAGGINSQAHRAYTPEKTPAGYKGYKINLSGLKGGHSGIDINLERGNANKIMNRFLYQAVEKFGIKLSSLEGGNMRNAIPREAVAEIAIPETNTHNFEIFAKEYQKEIFTEYQPIETNLLFEVKSIDTPAFCLDEKTQKDLLSLVYVLPNGPARMSADMPDVVETSSNLSIVKATDGKIELKSLLRSAVESSKFDLLRTTEAAYSLAGFSYDNDGNYPGWKPNVHSPILTTMKKVYKDEFGKEPEIQVVHAGLECGIIGGVYPKMDMISFGPTIMHPHSPDEKTHIPSVEKYWKYLTATLANISTK